MRSGVGAGAQQEVADQAHLGFEHVVAVVDDAAGRSCARPYRN